MSNTCCGCIDLRIGCLIIGYLQLVGEITFSIVALQYFVPMVLYAGSLGAFLNTLIIILMTILALSVAFTITLLIGLHQSKRGCVKAFLIYSAIFLVLEVIMLFLMLIVPPSVDRIITFVTHFVALLIQLYFLLVIRSYYVKMDAADIEANDISPSNYNAGESKEVELQLKV